jgi:hypothetical protein
MTKVIKCDCGFVARGDSDDELVKGSPATRQRGSRHGLHG